MVKNLTPVDSITVNRNPSSDNELANKNYVEESLGGDNILRFDETIDVSLKVPVGNDIYIHEI